MRRYSCCCLVLPFPAELTYNGAIPLDEDVRARYLAFGEHEIDQEGLMLRRLISLDFENTTEVKEVRRDVRSVSS